jgi:hypothetical protein
MLADDRAQRMADHMPAAAAIPLDQRGHIVRERDQVERFRRRAAARSGQIRPDAFKEALEHRHLRREHVGRAAQAVDEQDRIPFALYFRNPIGHDAGSVMR